MNFLKLIKKDKDDILTMKQKINNLYKQALQISTKKDDWEKEEKRIKNNLARVLLNKEGCYTAF